MIIRELTRPDEFETCLDLQQDGFGWSERELMPSRFFVVSRHVGGLVLGAFDESKLVGFLSAIPGIRNGKPYWHSHMLAVTSGSRDAGIGTQLKAAQKTEALKRGIRLIEWTFDPLVSRNAYLNIEKLGVIVRRYYPSFYEEDSDRLIAEWWLDRPHPAIEGEQRRVTIPADPALARAARVTVREAFQANINDDFYVAGFQRHGSTSDYIFIKGASRVDLAD
ncbi:MAG TPA: GNAT family N-acetyltransferase [Terriglobia bacterium]|nr:GNAT family N-acetyltransferase [Terriglobia bacterium]